MSAPTPEFRSGGEAAQEASKSSGGSFRKTHWFSLDDGEQAVLRYVLDKHAWLFVDQHGTVPTKNKPAGFEGNWPVAMPAVCRYDKAFKGFYTDCYIDDAKITNKYGRLCKATVREWSIACLREPVIGTEEMVAEGSITPEQVGKRLGYKDQIREVEVPTRNAAGEVVKDSDGKIVTEKVEERALVVVNFAPNNFFNALTATAGIYGTACDRDYIVKRTGDDKDTEYTHAPLDRTMGLHPAFTDAQSGEKFEETESWGRYAEAIKEQGLDLGKLIADRASDEYFARFFDPNKADPSAEKAAASGDAPTAPDAPSSDVDPDRLAAMRDRVKASAGTVKPSEID